MSSQTATATEYTTVELLTLAGPEHRRVSTAPPRPATLEEIPVVDLRGMKFAGDGKAQVVSAVRTAATMYGFFYIKNHGIPESVIDGALRQAKRFFSQSEEDKMRAWSKKTELGNGFSGVRSSQINRSETKDAKEGFQFRYQPKYDPQVPDAEAIPESVKSSPQGEDRVWEQTSHLEGFREATVAWWQHCLSLARGLVRIFALALELPEDYFDDVTTYPGSDGLYIHYPGTARGPEEDIDVGLGSHTDMQCFTLLWQDMLGGLQILSSADEWIEATPIPGTIVVNIADFLQRLSNNKFRSTVHRVYNRQQASRYSMPFFFGFNCDAVCSVVPTCVDEKHPPLYEPISCGEWRDRRIALATEIRGK